MPTLCSPAIEAARSQALMFQRRAIEAIGGGDNKAYSVSRLMAGGSVNFQEIAYGQTTARHQEHYAHNTGWVHPAVKCIANRLAGQKIKMGRKVEEPPIVSWLWDRPPGRKMTVLDKIRSSLPAVKTIDADIEQIDDHPILDALASPNPTMTSYSLIYVTVFSLQLTGIGYWWFVEGNDGKLQIWPVPSHWVTPIHGNDELFERYRIRPLSQSGQEVIVPRNEMARFALPDPANPTGAISPAQTQAPAIATDEAIQVAQWRSFKNGIFPGVIIRAGRHPSITGVGEGLRPYMTPSQRRELFTAIKAMYQGVTNYGEPLIVDQVIEGVDKFTQTAQEMDFLNSGSAVKNRIFQAFGVSPVIAGEIVGVNYATAAAADRIFVDNVVNPLAMLISQVMTAYIGEPDTYFWFEIAKAGNAEQRLREWQFGAQYSCVTENEIRQQILELPPKEDGDKYVTAGGGGGGFGFGGFGGAQPKPQQQVTGETGGTGGTPATPASGNGRGNALSSETANVPASSNEAQDQTSGERSGKPKKKHGRRTE